MPERRPGSYFVSLSEQQRDEVQLDDLPTFGMMYIVLTLLTLAEHSPVELSCTVLSLITNLNSLESGDVFHLVQDQSRQGRC